MKTVSALALATALLARGASAVAAADDGPANLPIGDPARREKTIDVTLDGVTDTTTGEAVTPRELAARLRDVRILFVGESHTSVEFHAAQRRVIEELHRAGRTVLVGLEMYPYTEQPWLDRWSPGPLDETAFLRDSRWYQNWGYHWNYYRDIFLFAQSNRLRMVAINTPRAVVSAVRRRGFANLTPEEAAHIPARVDTDSADHRRLFRSYFGGDDALHVSGMTPEQFDGMYSAQATWDATMGFNAVQAIKASQDPRAIIVVLIGSGHVAYGLGAQRQAALWFEGKMASLIPAVHVTDTGEPAKVRASYADYVWGVAKEEFPAYPTLGLSHAEQKVEGHFKVISVQKGSAAEKAGFLVNDLLVSMDGQAVGEKEVLNRLMSEKRWGDDATFVVKRGTETKTLVARLRRAPGRESM